MLRILLPLPLLQPAASCDETLRLETAAERLKKEALPVCPRLRDMWGVCICPIPPMTITAA